MKYRSRVGVLALAGVLLLTGCGSAQPSSFSGSIPITVVSREDGSGTRSAFVELFGLQQEQADGQLWDATTLEAVTVNNTAVVMNTVSGNPYAIGYLSFGSMNDVVKALKIDGASPTAENVLDGSYAIARPFLVATGGQPSAVTQDFIRFILSTEGQAVVSTSGFVPITAAGAYSGSRPAGKVVVAGSSSVAPLMEKLKEAYETLNPTASIEIQQSDSSTGLGAIGSGICDMAMASRALTDNEREAGLLTTLIAMDGIAVVVNNENPISELSSDQVRAIFSGQETTWAVFLQ